MPMGRGSDYIIKPFYDFEGTKKIYKHFLPIVTISVNTFDAYEPARKPIAHNNEPEIATTRHQYFFTKNDAIGPVRTCFSE